MTLSDGHVLIGWTLSIQPWFLFAIHGFSVGGWSKWPQYLPGVYIQSRPYMFCIILGFSCFKLGSVWLVVVLHAGDIRLTLPSAIPALNRSTLLTSYTRHPMMVIGCRTDLVRSRCSGLMARFEMGAVLYNSDSLASCLIE